MGKRNILETSDVLKNPAIGEYRRCQDKALDARGRGMLGIYGKVGKEAKKQGFKGIDK